MAVDQVSIGQVKRDISELVIGSLYGIEQAGEAHDRMGQNQRRIINN